MKRALSCRWSSRLVLAVWLAGVATPALLPHSSRFDFVCSDEAWASPHDATWVESAQSPVTDGHCAVCHLQRVAGSALAGHDASLAGPQTAPHRSTFAPQQATAGRAQDVPARAPPVVFL